MQVRNAPQNTAHSGRNPQAWSRMANDSAVTRPLKIRHWENGTKRKEVKESRLPTPVYLNTHSFLPIGTSCTHRKTPSTHNTLHNGLNSILRPPVGGPRARH